jgi:hypothetical protein
MTTYPAGLSKAVYLDRFAKEGLEVGNHLNSDICIGEMPSYADVRCTTHAPTSPGTFNYVSWTIGTHTGVNVVLSTSTLATCVLIPTVTIAFDDSGTLNWQPNYGVEVRLERSINGGVAWSSTVSQIFMPPISFSVGSYQGTGPLASLMRFSTDTTFANIVLRLGTRAVAYDPTSGTRLLNPSMRVLVFNNP